MTDSTGVNREYRDRLFRFIFGRSEKKEWTLSLYNAVNGTCYTDANALTLNTIDDVLYVGMKNDVSFLIGDTMNLYEQQSTFNPNMPMRFLMYAGMLYGKYIQTNEEFGLYSSKLQHAPTPKCVCFYNGADDEWDRLTLRLSDAFSGKSDIEVKVEMVNLNSEQNEELLSACQPLYEYVLFVDRVRVARRTPDDLERAVDVALNKLPEESLIKPYLIANKAEVKQMCLTEYGFDRALADQRRDGKEEGLKVGLKVGRKEGREEGRKEGRKEGREEGRLETFVELVKDGLLSVKEAARRVNMTVPEFEKATGLKA